MTETCLYCQSTNKTVLYEKKLEFDFCRPFEQQICQCNTCGMIFTSEKSGYEDKNLSLYYKYTSRTPCNLGGINKKDPRVINAQQRLNFIKRYKSSGSLLEVGCGDGVSLFCAKKYGGFDATGVDTSVGYQGNYDALAKEGIEVIQDDFSNIELSQNFDLVCNYLVLEHIKRPVEFLTQLKRYLKQDGILIIEIPDIAMYAESYSENMLTHEHLFHFSKSSIGLIAKSAGLTQRGYERKTSYGFSSIFAFSVDKTISKKIGDVHKLSIKESQTDLALFNIYLQNLNRFNLSLANLIKKLVDEKKQPVALFGIGEFWLRIERLHPNIINSIDMLVDDTPSKQGDKVDSLVIKGSDSLKDFNGVVWVAVPNFELQIKQLVQSLNPNLRCVLLNSEIEKGISIHG